MIHALHRKIESFKNLPSWKQAMLVLVLVILPAGIILGSLLYAFWSKPSRKQ